jgi:KDO2-lipid IV(A) lauroyltransferase
MFGSGGRDGGYAVIFRLTRAIEWLAGRVPRAPRLWVAGALAEVVYLAWVPKRRVTVANLAQVLGVPPDHPRARQVARRAWRNYGRYVSEFFWLPNTTADAVIARQCDLTPAPGWRALLDGAREGRRGVVFATAHFGNWDVAGVIVAATLPTPLHVIAETFADPRQNELIQRQRAAMGMTVVPMERSLRLLLRVLQEGGALGTPVDRPLGPGEGVPITFFGRRCYVPGGMAQLALKTGSAVAVGFVYYDDAYSPRFYSFLAPPILPAPTGDRQADMIALTQRIYDAIADMVRAHPDQWYMFRRFWPDEPVAEPDNAAARWVAAPARGAQDGDADA